MAANDATPEEAWFQTRVRLAALNWPPRSTEPRSAELDPELRTPRSQTQQDTSAPVDVRADDSVLLTSSAQEERQVAILSRPPVSEPASLQDTWSESIEDLEARVQDVEARLQQLSQAVVEQREPIADLTKQAAATNGSQSLGIAIAELQEHLREDASRLLATAKEELYDDWGQRLRDEIRDYACRAMGAVKEEASVTLGKTLTDELNAMCSEMSQHVQEWMESKCALEEQVSKLSQRVDAAMLTATSCDGHFPSTYRATEGSSSPPHGRSRTRTEEFYIGDGEADDSPATSPPPAAGRRIHASASADDEMPCAVRLASLADASGLAAAARRAGERNEARGADGRAAQGRRGRKVDLPCSALLRRAGRCGARGLE